MDDRARSEHAAEPLVTIGMPVRNGALHLEEAVRSLLGQTEENFVLLISDNCSTDETQEICERLAAEDPRIRYVRQERDIGAAANFGSVLREAEGPFFMWAAHDDLWARDFLEECLRLLIGSPDAVGCAVAVARIDRSGARIGTTMPPRGLADPDLVKRARAARHEGWEAIYSLFRRDRLPTPDILPNVSLGDLAFVFRLAIDGPFVISDRELSSRRIVGRKQYLGPDGRIHSEKRDGPEAHLYSERFYGTCRLMWTYLDEGPVTSWQRFRLRLWLIGLWFRLSRQRMLGDGRVRIEDARERRRYVRLAVLALRQVILRPRVIVPGMRRLLGRTEPRNR